MKYLLIILIGTAVIWTTYFIIRAIEKKREHITDYSTIINVPLKNTSPKSKHPIKVQKTDDMIYAELHRMWICPHCETINETHTLKCAACGYPKN